jgi:hypothetical protein
MRVSSRLVMQSVLAALSALSLACGSSSDLADRIAGHRASPFALFGRDDMRAGLRFDVLRDAAKKESLKQYECVPLWVKAQRCTVPIESGVLVAILDSTAHVIRLLAATDTILRNGINVHGQLIFRDVVRDTRKSWDSVGVMQRNDADPITPQLSWVDRSRHWSGSLWYSRAHRADVPRSSAAASDAELAMTLPESLGVTDLPAYALFTQLRPPPRLSPRNRAVAEAPPAPPTRDEILTMLRSDLRAVTIAEEGALHRTGIYETRLDRLELTPSPDVSVELVNPTTEGWSAVAIHPGLPGLSCVVYAGDVAAPPVTQRVGRHGRVGEIVCD